MKINSNCADDENTCDHNQSRAMVTILARSFRQIRACAAALNASDRLHYDPVTLSVDLVHIFPFPALPSDLVGVEARINARGELASKRPCDMSGLVSLA
jgi:hypothetical protein